MEHLKAFLKNKQAQDQSKAPKYGMRKLSVGFVSCFLGCAVFMAPMGVHAESEAAPAPVAAVETQAKPAEAKPVEVKSVEATEASVAEASSAEATVAEASSAEADTTVGENAAFETQDTTVERETESEAAAVAVADQVETAEAEAPKQEAVAEKKAVDTKDEEKSAEVETADSADKDSEDQTSEEKPQAVDAKSSEAEADAQSLELSGEVDPKALKTDGSEATPISAETGVIKNVEITIGGADNGDKTTTVNPTASDDRIDGEDTDLNLKTRIDFDIPEGTRSGSSFEILISDNVNFNGIVKEEKIKAVEYNGEEIATGEKLTGEKRGYKYTFNENIDDLTDIRVRLEYPLFIDPKAVPGDSPKETVKVSLASEDGTIIGENSKDFAVEYEKGVYEVDPEAHTVTVSGSANITNVTENTYEHVIYVNPTGDQGLTGSHVEIKNQEYEETYTDDYGNERKRKKAYDGAIFDEDVKNSVKVYKIIDKDKFNLSYDLEGVDLEDVTTKAKVEIVEDLWGGPSYLTVDVNQENHDDSVYIVTYNGKRKPNQATKTNVEFTAESRQMEGYETTAVTKSNGGWFWTNEILFDDPKTVAEANKVYNLGDRVWIDANKNGIQDEGETGLANVEVTLKGDDILPVTVKTNADGKYLFKKLKDGSYTVEFTVPDGYEPTTANAEGGKDENNSDASVAVGAEVATATGKIKGEDNLNVDFGVIETEKAGSFIEHHIYITKDQDGVETGRTKEDGKLQEGKKEESYTTSKVEKDGFTLVRTETPVEEPTYNKDGAEAKGNYKPGVKQEITYVYEKTVNDPQKEPGSFIEHHIYITKDQDGVETGRTKEDGKLQEGKKEESYTTSKVEKDGFTLVRTETPVEEPTYNKDGAEAKGNYKPGVKQEITYVYEKTVKKPVEPNKPEDPNPTPNEPGEPSKPVNPTPNTPNEPTGWIPVKPVDPKTPENPVKEEPKNPAPQNPVKEDPKNPVPETPVKEEPKNPAPQTPEKPVQPKTVDKKVEKPVESKAEEKETLTTDAPVTTKKEVGQPKVSKGDDREGKAPQTFDAGVASYASLAGLASGALAYLESKKRKNK